MSKFFIFLFLLLSPTFAFAIEDAAVNASPQAADFELQSFFGDKFSLKDNLDKIVVLEWTNPGCPFVKKHYQNNNMQSLQKKYREKGVVWVSINSTREDHQDFLTPEGAKKNAEEWKIDGKFMLNDSDGKVGKLYQAKSTPHFFIIQNGKLVYQGAIDNNPDVFENDEPKTNYVSNALDSLLASTPIKEAKTNPYGCGVKYKD